MCRTEVYATKRRSISRFSVPHYAIEWPSARLLHFEVRISSVSELKHRILAGNNAAQVTVDVSTGFLYSLLCCCSFIFWAKCCLCACALPWDFGYGIIIIIQYLCFGDRLQQVQNCRGMCHFVCVIVCVKMHLRFLTSHSTFSFNSAAALSKHTKREEISKWTGENRWIYLVTRKPRKFLPQFSWKTAMFI